MGLRVDRLRTLRELRGFSQRELARRCGLSDTQIFKYENAVTDPTAHNLATIADQLGVSTDYLLGRTDDQNAILSDGSITTEEQAMIEIFRREGWPGVIRMGADRVSR
jgi:transcriptional regulator with XRE-family HTH domain